MRIAQVAPLYEAVPPLLYGGTERVVSYLTEELVALGHDVTLYASGDSVTSARLVSCSERALRLWPEVRDGNAYHVLQFERVLKDLHSYDVVHFHGEPLHYPLSRLVDVPMVTTLHGRLDLPELVPLYREFFDVPLVSISNSQRTPLPWAAWRGTVLHGLPTDLLPVGDGGGGYLAFVGRISPEKDLVSGIEIARRAGRPLKLAAKVDEADRKYFETVIRPLLDDPLIEFLGEIDEAEKGRFLGDALAMLFPVDWPEPFGLAMIEAMACGTPVIARRRGSVPEVVDDGITGFIYETIEEGVAAIDAVARLDRAGVRRHFVERFSARRMALDYLAIYAALCTAKPSEVIAS
ncbi:MAG: glycosyltransferase family 4 protein [Alphaproteobacteria bacterium]|nr:glycosyltransferase family 4 protein [Alphaproteobacteria bacterium]